MIKIFVASFNRASDGAISKLVQKMKDEDIWTDDYEEANYILAVGDRRETFDFVLERYRENKRIIHLWAGEKSNFELHDDVYRHAMTLMSCIQLCTNDEAKKRVVKLCKSVGKIYLTMTVGNVMFDNLEVDESVVPDYDYDLILYNPVTSLPKDITMNEIKEINNMIDKPYLWIEPNGDHGSELILDINTNTLPRSLFLGLVKNCKRFITNSSCQYYEAQFLLKPEQIISIGKRNKERESRYANMSIPNATENIMKILRSLDEDTCYSPTR